MDYTTSLGSLTYVVRGGGPLAPFAGALVALWSSERGSEVPLLPDSCDKPRGWSSAPKQPGFSPFFVLISYANELLPSK